MTHSLHSARRCGRGLHAGFTLIELLVVVLIIGILAAVAIPQYQKSVLRSRMAQALVTGRSVMDAQERYYMANGKYTTRPEELDIGFTCPKGYGCSFSGDQADEGGNERKFSISYRGANIVFSYAGRQLSRDGRIYCVAHQSDVKAQNFCKTYSTVPQRVGSYLTYTIQ